MTADALAGLRDATLMPTRVRFRRPNKQTAPYAVFVGPGTSFANPYFIKPDLQHLSWFENDLKKEAAAQGGPTEDHPWALHFWKMARLLPELRGKTLACSCPLDKPCHADVLLKLANADATAARGAT